MKEFLLKTSFQENRFYYFIIIKKTNNLSNLTYLKCSLNAYINIIYT